ncbi:MAG TPA: lytic transglycosylase domain-containing protein [bacterium]|nr:lytic transglycosylase domain-containing protein [bacterium]
MPIDRRLGGAPRWLVGYMLVCLAALLLAATILYVTAADVMAAVSRLPRDGTIPRSVHGIPYAELINRAARNHRLNPALVAAVVFTESGFHAQARSSRGAYGLMQVVPATWRELAGEPACAPEIARLTDPPCMDDPASNLETGTAYLRRLVDQFKGNLPYALAAYNAGAGTVERHEGIPPFPETTRYLRQVALVWLHLQQDGTLTPVWRILLRSANVGSYARAAVVISLIGLTLPLLWVIASPASRPPLAQMRQGVRR